MSILHISVLYKSPSGSLRLQYTLLAYMWHSSAGNYTIPYQNMYFVKFCSYLSEAITDYKLTWGNLVMSKFSNVTTFHWLAVQPTHPLTEWTNKPTNEPTEPLTDQPTDWPNNQLTNRNLLQQLILPHLVKIYLTLYINVFCTVRLLVSLTHKIQCNITVRYQTSLLLKKTVDRRICKRSSYLQLHECSLMTDA